MVVVIAFILSLLYAPLTITITIIITITLKLGEAESAVKFNPYVNVKVAPHIKASPVKRTTTIR